MKIRMGTLTFWATVLLITNANIAIAAKYAFTDIGTLGGDYSIANSINNLGHVVGASTVNANTFSPQAFIWDGSQIARLNQNSHNIGSAFDINDYGQVVGFESINGNFNATLWNNGAVDYLGADSSARGINNSGQIVGDFTNIPTLWAGSNITLLSPPPRNGFSQNGYASAINELGKVVGATNLADNTTRATLWSPNGARFTTTYLATLGGTDSYAYDINDYDLVVGTSYTSNNSEFIATLWNGQSVYNLGALNGSSRSDAFAINNSGQIVGSSFSSIVNSNYATLWENNQIIDLNSLLDADTVNAGWVLNEANDINDNGYIVGNAFNLNTRQTHAFLLSPIPEPETFLMLLVGLGLIGFNSRTRSNQT
ncbi:MAG: hypothetical protein CTY10_08075 [Methylotenera sp.]|nr:MAG: hypothetical protein CTY10_08075 [Methylotenera sp.]